MRGLTQRDLIDEVNRALGTRYAPQSVSQWESGSNPGAEVIRTLDDVLGAGGGLLALYDLERPEAGALLVELADALEGLRSEVARLRTEFEAFRDQHFN